MIKTPVIAVVLVVTVMLLASCKATVMGRVPVTPPTGPTEPHGPDGPVIVVTWPVAPPLTGPSPVGRWACINGWPDFDDIKASNSSQSPAACTIARGYALEFIEDGSGNTLTKHRRPSS